MSGGVRSHSAAVTGMERRSVSSYNAVELSWDVVTARGSIDLLRLVTVSSGVVESVGWVMSYNYGVSSDME